MFRSLLQTWLQNAAKAKVRDAVTQAARVRRHKAAKRHLYDDHPGHRA